MTQHHIAPQLSHHPYSYPSFFNDFKINWLHYHNMDTFSLFVSSALNLKPDIIKELVTNPKIQLWIERNKSNGFIYQAYPKSENNKQNNSNNNNSNNNNSFFPASNFECRTLTN